MVKTSKNKKQVAASRSSSRAKKRKRYTNIVTENTPQPTTTAAKKRRVKNALAERKKINQKPTAKQLFIQEETKVDDESSYEFESDADGSEKSGDDSDSDGSDDNDDDNSTTRQQKFDEGVARQTRQAAASYTLLYERNFNAWRVWYHFVRRRMKRIMRV